jgi:HK97 family phage major capsid protein
MSKVQGSATEDDLKQVRKEVEQLKDKEARQRQEADDLVASIRQSGSSPFDKEAFDKVDAKYREADETAGELSAAQERLARVGELAGTPAASAPAVGGDGSSSPGGGDRRSAAWQDRVVESDAYQRLVQSGVLRSRQGSVALDPVEVASRDELLASGLFQAQTIGSHGPLVPTDERLAPPPVLAPQREIRMIDMINVAATDSDTVEYVEETSRTSAAAGVAFGTNLPEFDISWQRVTTPVRRRGVEHTATRGNLADQGQLRSIIEMLLDEDVRLEAEEQIINGDGTGENWVGVYNTSGIGSVTGQTGEAYLDALHRGLTTIRLNSHRDPTALGIHPNDHETVILSKDGSGAYRMGSAAQSDRKTIWGLPAIPSPVFTEELPVWGHWGGATLWQREGITVSAYDQHEDYASRGLVLITAEHRGAFRVRRPTRFCTVDFSTI